MLEAKRVGVNANPFLVPGNILLGVFPDFWSQKLDHLWEIVSNKEVKLHTYFKVRSLSRDWLRGIV